MRARFSGLTGLRTHHSVTVIQPTDPSLAVSIPAWPRETVEKLSELSWGAARREAMRLFDEFKEDQAAIVEQELERLTRMFDSRRGFVDDRVARNEREISRLERFGTESQKRIIPARKGQIDADRRRLAELERERSDRVNAVQMTAPSHLLRALGATIIVPVGRLEKLAMS